MGEMIVPHEAPQGRPRLSRRRFTALTAGLGLALVTGCTKEPADEQGDMLDWLSGLDGVQHAELIPEIDYPIDERVLLTLADELPDAEVRSLATTVKEGGEAHLVPSGITTLLLVDDFHAQFYPRPSTPVDPDLDRALWLRSDGRATAMAYGASRRIVVTAPQPDVAALALDYSTVAPAQGGRQSHRVESAEGEMIVQWTQIPDVDFALDEAAARHLADLQRQYPNTTGWLESDGKTRAGFHFSPEDVDLATVIRDEESLMPSDLTKSDLGWGPGRARRGTFATAFTGRIRTLLEHLAEIEGVREFRVDVSGGEPRPMAIVVRDRAGYRAVLEALPALWEDYLTIQLIRGRSPYLGQLPPEVFRSSNLDGIETVAFYTQVADLTGVWQAQLGIHDGTGAANLVLVADLSDDELDRTLAAVAEVPADVEWTLYGVVEPEPTNGNAFLPLGMITNNQFTDGTDPAQLPPTGMVERVAAAWERAVG